MAEYCLRVQKSPLWFVDAKGFLGNGEKHLREQILWPFMLTSPLATWQMGDEYIGKEQGQGLSKI